MERFEILLLLSFMIAHFSVIATIGDWFIFKKEMVIDFGPKKDSCVVYGGEAYNLYGSLCGIRVSSVETYMSTMQILLPIAFGFSLILFFLVVFRRLRRNMIRLTASVIIALELASCILWQTVTRVDLSSDALSINYYGIGWVMTLVSSFTAFGIIVFV